MKPVTLTPDESRGHLAMLGFSALLLELISGQGPLHALGLL